MKEKKPPKMMQHVTKAVSAELNSAKQDDDSILWQAVTQHVTKYGESNKIGKREAGHSAPPAKPRQSPTKQKFVPVLNGQITLESFASLSPATQAPLSSYQVDAALEKRFTKGDMPMDGTIDLHGLTLAEAHQQFMRFMTRKIGDGARCVLVVTGKGSTETENGRGVIRKNLPLWCEDRRLGLHILKISKASPRHGGAGAFYILLRRKR